MRNYNNRNELYIKLLLETPHGFAIFTLRKPACLLDEHEDEDETLKYLWTNFVSGSTAKSIVQSRDDYERLDDKSLAIDVVTGHVDKHLGNKLKTLCMHGKTLAVGTPQQATIIQSQLGIRCLHNDVVMELMWGLKFLLEYFVPEEKESGLTGERNIHMSKGLDILLRRHGFHVQPNMVTKRVVNLALTLFHCDYDANFYSCHSSYLTNLLMEVSDIDCRDWDHLKRATAFKMICLPRERKHLLAQPHMMFTPDEASRLQAAQPAQYDGRMNVPTILYLYKTALSLMQARRDLGDSLGISTEKPFGWSE